MDKRKGFKFITVLPENERVVAMLIYNKVLHFATDMGIYKIKKNRVVKIIEVSGREGTALSLGQEKEV